MADIEFAASEVAKAFAYSEAAANQASSAAIILANARTLEEITSAAKKASISAKITKTAAAIATVAAEGLAIAVYQVVNP